MKNLFLVMAASLFGLSASAQVLITDAEYLSRRTERVEARAARNSADLKRMDSIVMSKGYRFVPDQFQQMPAGVAHTIYNPNFMLTVRGESMIEAGIMDGDYILVEQQNTARNGDMVVALIDDSATVKTFYREKGHIRLQPENDNMDPIIVNDCKILGKVFGVFRIYH